LGDRRLGNRDVNAVRQCAAHGLRVSARPKNVHCHAVKPAEKSCCAKPSNAKQADQHPEPLSGPAMKAPDCAKAVTQPETLTIEQRQADLHELMSLTFDRCPIADVFCVLPFVFLPTDLDFREPPPTDRVVAFQHFTI
jgi:hypothetical protein